MGYKDSLGDTPWSDTALARSSDPQTAHDAAASIRMGKLSRQCYEFIERCGQQGATKEEIAVALGVERDSVSPRLRPLADKGSIFESKEKRPGRSGKGQIVWKVTKWKEVPA